MTLAHWLPTRLRVVRLSAIDAANAAYVRQHYRKYEFRIPIDKTQPAWSPDGKAIAFTRWEYRVDFLLLAPE